MSSSPSEPATKEQLETITRLLQRTKTSKLQRRGGTYRPYYREDHAIMFRDTVMVKLAAGKDASISTNPSQNFNTITNLLSQARQYLFDHLDPDGTYKALWSNTRSIVKQQGVVRTYVYALKLPITEIYGETAPDYSSSIFEFLNSLAGRAEGECVLKFPKVRISEEDVIRYTEMFAGFEEVVSFHISTTSIYAVNAKG